MQGNTCHRVLPGLHRLEINLFTPIPYQYYIHEVHDGQMNGDSLFQFRNPKNKSHQLLYTVTKLTQIQIPLVSVIRFVRHRTLYHSVSNKQQEFQENEYDTSLHMWNPINNLQFYLPQINGMNLDKYSTDIIHICMIRFLVHATIAVRH